MIILVDALSSILIALSMLMGLYRLVIGPGLLNRILAFDLIAICIISITVIFSRFDQEHYFSGIMLIFCLLGFITTIAFMDMLFRYVERKEDTNE